MSLSVLFEGQHKLLRTQYHLVKLPKVEIQVILNRISVTVLQEVYSVKIHTSRSNSHYL